MTAATPPNIFYHVTNKWDGGCLNSLYLMYGEEAYSIFLRKWPLSGDIGKHHVHFVHMYGDLREAQDHRNTFGGEILIVDNSSNVLVIKLDTVEFHLQHWVCTHIPEKFVRRLLMEIGG